jgi:uncharacterized phage protein (TIGR02218 family)
MPISTAIKNALAEGTGIYPTVVKVTATPEKGGDILAYALHTADIDFEGTTYIAAPFEPSKMAQAAGVSVDNSTLTHILADLFTRANIKGGKWSGATIDLYAVDLKQLDQGPVRAHHGRLGDVTTAGEQAQSQYRGLMQLLNQEQGDRTSRRCRYQLGDADCTLNLAAFTFAGTIVGVTNSQKVTVSVSKPDGYFKYGRIQFTSGENDGLEMEIINNTGTLLTLWQPFPGTIAIGNAINLIAGDDKSLAVCHAKFNNAVNHGGEDSLPRIDDVFAFPQ